MKTDFCVCLLSSCPGMVFRLLWVGLQSHVVRLRSLSTVYWVMVGWVAPLVAVADGAVDCGSVESSTARWSHVASGLYIVVFQVSWLYYGSHLVMEGWVASLVVIADGATSTELAHCLVNFVLWTLFYLCVWHVCAFYVLYVCVFSCMYTCPMGVYMDLVNWCEVITMTL